MRTFFTADRHLFHNSVLKKHYKTTRYDYDYYVSLWENVYKTLPGEIETVDVSDAYKIFQTFWEALPDHSAIRRDPFIDICDMAEKYCFVLAECYDEVGDSFDEDTSV
mgnify:FL=1